MNILSTAFIFSLAPATCLAVLYLQTAEVKAFLGESVILPCNATGLPEEEPDVQWEAVGKDVASLSGGVFTVGNGYEGRVKFLTDATGSDFSLVLSDVMMSDEDIYECLWKGQRPISSVMVEVLEPPDFSDHVVALEGEEITLLCYGNIHKNKPWEEIYIQWLKDDKEILQLISGKILTDMDYTNMTLPPKEEIYRGIISLTIKSVSVWDQGVYKCRYKTTNYEEPRSGFPETYTVTVWAASSEMTATTESLDNATESSHTDTSRTVTAWTDVESTPTKTVGTLPTQTYAESIQTATGSSVPTQTYAESTQTERGSTVPTQTFAEMVKVLKVITETSAVPEATTSSRDRVAFEFHLDEKIPWVRIGVISVVLLVTVMVLGSLLALGRI